MTHKIITIGDGAANIAKSISTETSKTIIIASLGGSKSRNADQIIRTHKTDNLVVILVMPMLGEGPTRNKRAEQYKAMIEDVVQDVIVFSNQTYAHQLPIKEIFSATDCDVREFISNLT